MSTLTDPASDSGHYLPENDPFLHGVRHVPRTLEDGTVVYDEIPLRQEDLLFPEEWDRHVITAGHQRDCRYMMDVFERQLHGAEGARVLGDLRVDWSHPEIRPMAPDVIVVLGARQWRDWSTFNVLKEGASAALIVEVTSPDTRENDLIIKRDLYYQLGVSFYAIVDRHDRRGVIELSVLGYHRGRSAFEELPRNDRGWIWLETVGVWFGVEGDRAICYRPDGTAIPGYRVMADALDDSEMRADAADRAAAIAKARADAERVRADAEASSRARLEERLREIEADLRRLRGEV
jgi:colicin import membrane protein